MGAGGGIAIASEASGFGVHRGTRVCVHIYIYLYMYIHIYIYIFPHMKIFSVGGCKNGLSSAECASRKLAEAPSGHQIKVFGF